MAALVLDASVALAATWPEERHKSATQAIMERVAAEGALVPTIWYWEVANSLVMRCRRGLLGPGDVPDILRELGALPIVSDPRPAVESWEPAVMLAVAYQLTSYDASYLELAQRTGLPLASFDAALRRAADAVGVPLANPVA